jgi:hypothetical protein
MFRGESDRAHHRLQLPAAGPTPLAPSSRIVNFKRLYRWLNLTLIQQASWPLLILLAGAPTGPPATTPWPWYLARLGGPTLAALLASIYLVQRPAPALTSLAVATGEVAEAKRSSGQSARARARFALVGIALMLAGARLAVGPSEPVAKLLVFGVADVLAFQLIHFGVVARSFVHEETAQAAAVGLFALSWGGRDLVLAGVGGGVELPLTLASGLVVGLAVALMSRVVRRWPGGFWAAAAAHWFVVYLVLSFVG